MLSRKDDLKQHISYKMIIPFFIITLVSIIDCDESSDNKYISKLPDTDKQVFLDNIARRILEEVPEIKSVETSGVDGGDVLEAKLKQQSDFVQKILKQEVDSLKAKRRSNATIKKNDAVSNITDLELNTESLTPVNQSVVVAVNNTRKADAVEASVGNKNNTETNKTLEAKEHIDLTLRTRDEDDDAEIITKNVTPKNQKSENYEQFVPVKVKYDEEILNVDKKSSKGGNRKREVMPDSIEKVHGAGVVLAKNKTRRKSHDTGNTSPTVTENTTDVKVNNNEILDLSITSTLLEETTETTTGIKKVVSETESTKKAETVTKTPPKSSKPRQKNLSNESESSEFLGENISVESKTEKEVETTVIKTTTTEPNLNITTLRTSEDPQGNLKSITPLTTTEAITSTSVRVENNTEKGSILRNRDEPNNETSTSTNTNEPPTTTPMPTELTTATTKKCDEKPCNQNKTEEKPEETETTVSTSKGVETTFVTNAPDAISKSPSSKITRKLRGSKDAVSKHAPNHMHFGDMQVTNAYEVFEVDPDTPPFVPQKPISERAEKVPVHIYDREHAFYNPHHRLESEPVLTQNVEPSSIRETIEDPLDMGPILDSLNEKEAQRLIKAIHHLDGKKQTQPSYRIKHRLEQMPETQEDEHPFQIHKKGLKDSLKAVRGILYSNKKFGYVPTNLEREITLNTSCIYDPDNFSEDLIKKMISHKSEIRCENVYAERKKKKDDLDSAREDTREERHPYNSITDFLKRYMNRPKKSTNSDTETYIQNMSYDIYRNKITVNGVTYNLYDDKLKNLFGSKEASSQESDVVKTVESWLRTGAYKVPKASATIQGHKSNKLAEVLNVLQKRNKWKSSEMLSEELKYLTSIDKPKSSEETREATKQLTAILQEKMPQLKRKVKSYSDQKLNPSKNNQDLRFYSIDGNFGKLDTIEKISVITPAKDLVENIDLMLAKNIKVTKANDEELESHLNILKDLVQMDNMALKRFDWLGTTVDIQAALRKLMDLTEKKLHHQRIHPDDMNLLKYVQGLYKKASEVLLQRDEENRRNSEEASRVLNDLPSKQARSFPKKGKTIRQPLKVLEHIWDLMNDQTAIQLQAALFKKIDKRLGRIQATLSSDEEFLIFLYTIKIRLDNFHEAIKQIASITTYNNQKWFRNIKDLFLTRAGKKEYLELLLHLFLTRLFDLIEENVMMGANKDFKQFMEDKRAEVDRTAVELVFILKILREIKQFK